MSPTMILVLSLLAMPIVAQESKADPLADLMEHARKLGFAVEEVWTERDGRVQLVLRPGGPTDPVATDAALARRAEAPTPSAPAPPDAAPLMASLTETLRVFGIADKIRIGQPRVRRGAGSTSIRLDFRQKEGYRYSDLVRLFNAIEKSDRRARLCSIDLGKRDPDSDKEIWRPTYAQIVLEAEPGSEGLSSLVHLGNLMGAMERVGGEDLQPRVERVRVDDRGIKWDMSIEAAALPAELFTAIKQYNPGTFSPGKISSPRAGLWEVSGSSVTFPRR